MEITRLYSDEKGESHFEDIEVELEDKGNIGKLSETVKATGIIFRETDGSYDYDWHNAPRKQYIIMLGEVEIEVSDGEVRRFKSGDILLVEDVTGKGHKAKAVDGKSKKSVFVTLD